MTRRRNIYAGHETYVYSTGSGGPKPGTVDLVLYRTAGAEIRLKLHPKAAEALASGRVVLHDELGELRLTEIDSGWYNGRELQIEQAGTGITTVIEMRGSSGRGLAKDLREAAAEGCQIQQGKS